MNLGTENLLFWVLVSLAGLTGVAAVWLAARSAKPAMPGLKLSSFSSRAGTFLRQQFIFRIVESLRYLMTRKESRYSLPWVLLLGDAGAGRSSLILSAKQQLVDPPNAGAELPVIADSTCRLFGRGLLIDPSAPFSDETGAKLDAKWSPLLNALDELRPERPIDKIVLVLSARALLGQDDEALMASAKRALHHLQVVQNRFEFSLPVYLLITQCDALSGFVPFWNANQHSLHSQILGWSAPPAMQSQPPAQWVESAFSSLDAALRNLLLACAAAPREYQDADQVFLFPVAFRRLMAPLSRWFEVVFQPLSWSKSFVCRGIYFTGSLASDASVPGPRGDLLFIQDLLKEKIFGEPHLAQPIRESIWSRNLMIRRVQFLGLGILAALVAVLGFSSWKLKSQIDQLDLTLATLKHDKKPLPAGTCADFETLSTLLSEVAKVEARTVYPAFVVSLVDHRAMTRSVNEITEASFKDVVMPAVACRLEQKAVQLTRPSRSTASGDANYLDVLRKQFIDYLGAVRAFEQAMDHFSLVSRSSSHDEKDKIVKAFEELVAYAYDKPLPEALKREKGAYSRALAHFSYGVPVTLPIGSRESFSKNITTQAAELQKNLRSELSVGANLLANLGRASETDVQAQADTTHLIWWLNWMRQSWLGATPSKNPCEDIRLTIDPLVQHLLSRENYRKQLGALGEHFGREQCYGPAMQILGGLRAAPYGALFVIKDDSPALNPELTPEIAGLAALMELKYMRLTPRPGFQCLTDLASWNSANLLEASGYAREYLEFAKTRKLSMNGKADDKAPIFERLARRQLLSAMNSAVRDAQAPPQAQPAMAGLNAISADERRLARESADFAAASGALLEVLNLYGQLDFKPAMNEIAQCAGNFASDSLRRARSLADVSRLYDPRTSGDSFPQTGDLATTTDWLSRQAGRARVLAGYASQFVAFLKNTQATDEHLWIEDRDAAFWDKTVAELERYIQFKDKSGQMGDLETLFIKPLAGLSAANCRKQLADYTPPPYGNDLFSRLRSQRLKQAMDRCAERQDGPAWEAYQTLAERFNRELAGRFPFGSLGDRDASPNSVKSFLTDYASQRDSLRTLLDGDKNRLPKVRAFLDQMDSVAAFFRGNLSDVPAATSIKMVVRFNSQPKLSQGANQLVSWSLNAGGNQAAYPNRPNTLEWTWGQSIEFQGMWATASLWRPAPDSAQSDLQISDTQASFQAGGAWGLLRLIAAHGSTLKAPDLTRPEQVNLLFNVPLMAQESSTGPAKRSLAKLTIGLELSDRKATAPLTWPALFPASAPTVKE